MGKDVGEDVALHLNLNARRIAVPSIHSQVQQPPFLVGTYSMSSPTHRQRTMNLSGFFWVAWTSAFRVRAGVGARQAPSATVVNATNSSPMASASIMPVHEQAHGVSAMVIGIIIGVGVYHCEAFRFMLRLILLQLYWPS